VSGTLARRYWQALIGARPDGGGPPVERGRDGYSLWQRYWAALFNVRLPPIRQHDRAGVPSNPLSEPYLEGRRIRLPRFDRAAVRMAATGEPERAAVSWAVGGRRFVMRESGPGQVDLLVETDRAVPAMLVLPVHVRGAAGERDLLMVFGRDPSGRSVGVLRLADAQDWIDVTVDGEVTGAELDAADPAVRATVADSVRATPDPGMAAWAEIVASRPAGDPLRQVIEDVAR
jgi:hypothetical protein